MLPRTKKEIVIYVSTKRNADKKRECVGSIHILHARKRGKFRKTKRKTKRNEGCEKIQKGGNMIERIR